MSLYVRSLQQTAIHLKHVLNSTFDCQWTRRTQMMQTLYIAQVFNDLDHELRICTTDELEVGQCLGEGNFGKVYQGLLRRRVCLNFAYR